MVISSKGDYDWAKEAAEFDETKAGVKGLVDAGLTKLPRLFVHPRDGQPHVGLQRDLPTIDLEDLNNGRSKVVEEIRSAAKEWGFFRIVNHGIPTQVMNRVLEGARRFHELPMQEKLPFYSVDPKKRVKFNSNIPTQENDAACWALIANIGDLMQIISNERFMSVEHRVVAQAVGPRISVAAFFVPSRRAAAEPFGHIKELLSEENPAMYREFMFAEYCALYKKKFTAATSVLPHFKI